MLKIYGSDICIDCRETKEFLLKRNIPFEFVDITLNTANLKEFLRFRDQEEIFDEVKEKGAIGIPFLVLGDRHTLDVEEAVSWIKE